MIVCSERAETIARILLPRLQKTKHDASPPGPVRHPQKLLASCKSETPVQKDKLEWKSFVINAATNQAWLCVQTLSSD